MVEISLVSAALVAALAVLTTLVSAVLIITVFASTPVFARVVRRTPFKVYPATHRLPLQVYTACGQQPPLHGVLSESQGMLQTGEPFE